MSCALTAPAQEISPTPEAAAETERIIVTGSNIPTAEEVGANPVEIINRDLINKSGERTTEKLLWNPRWNESEGRLDSAR